LRFIDGQTVVVEHNGAAIEIVGVPVTNGKTFPTDFNASVPPKKPGVPRVMISHYPDHIRQLESLGPDIYWPVTRMAGRFACRAGCRLFDMIRCRGRCARRSSLSHAWFVVSGGWVQ